MDTTTNNHIDEEPASEQIETTHPRQKTHDRRRRLVFIGVVLTVLGWLTLMLNEGLSVGLTVAGLVISAIGVRIPPGPRRNLAITSIIAAAVLLLVIVALELTITLLT